MSVPYSGKPLKYVHGNLIHGDDVRTLEQQLSKRGFLSPQYIDGVYDLYTERAVKSFQLADGITPTGVTDRVTWESLFKSDAVNSDRVADQPNYEGSTPNSVVAAPNEDFMPHHTYDGTPKRTPFFNVRNSKKLRKTDMELRIDFGANSPLSKTIKHLYLRSVGVEVDASGNPLYEIFEFIAQDVEENDNTFIAE